MESFYWINFYKSLNILKNGMKKKKSLFTIENIEYNFIIIKKKKKKTKKKKFIYYIKYLI